MTIGGINRDEDDESVSMDEIVEELSEFIKENYDKGQCFKSKYVDLELDVDNMMIGKAIPDAIDEAEGFDAEMWSEGNCNTWMVTKNE